MSEQVTGNAFLDTLLEQAPPTASQPRRGQNYNYEERLYLKPDGTVVQLQGDPHNRAYYQDKGYHMLSDSPGRNSQKSEVRQYLEDEYPKLLKEQREKAAIINAIRRAESRDAALNIDTDYDIMSVQELRDFLKQVKEESGKNIKVIVGKHRDDAPDATERRLLQGVDTTAQSSIEALQAQLTRGQRKGG
jgi:hypothetical protein